MTTYRALVLDPDTCLTQHFEQAQFPNLTLCPTATEQQFCASIAEEATDFVVLDLGLPGGVSGLELVGELRKKNPTLPALLLTTENPSDQVWQAVAAKPWIQLMRMPVSPGELQYHLARFMESVGSKQRSPAPLKVNPFPEIRNDDSGRLDASKIANVFDLTMNEVALCVGRPRSTLVKTSDSVSIQPKLRHFERIANGLLTVTGSMKGLKMWLNSPGPSLDNHTPLEVLRLGKVELLAGWVDDARLGSPD